MNPTDEDPLIELAGRIADGLPVDWADPATAELQLGPLADEFRALEAMARCLRPAGGEAADAGPPRLEGFTIERELGSGGAGVVYLARDERLERRVALKVLPGGVALDPDRIARIEREAKVLASLNHPHVATIHGMAEDTRGSRVLILEYVPGETLAERLQRGRLELDEAAEICGAVARALVAAHEGGVVHRDLKPANVMLGPNGRVKVLDFGLALRPGPDVATGPVISGTWAYLSPECLTQRENHTADLFAFGCVLYECLTGTRAFPGETAHETLVAVLGREPDWTALPAETPHAVRLLLEECLEKDPARRLGDLRQACEALDSVRGAAAPAPAPPLPGLPHYGTRFVGRGREQTECRHALLEARLVTLLGPGGSGKTRLAAELARVLRSRFPAGIWFADLAPVSEPTRVPDAVAAVLGVSDDGRPRADQIVDRLREGSALLVLDNCEHVRTACAELALRLVAGCAALAVLATSREPLGLDGERRIEIGPLGLAPETERNPEALARCAAVQLFVDRARRADPGFAADPAALSGALEICRRVDGLPLAIELAAARVSVLSAEEIARRLDRQLPLLRASGGASGRHDTMRAAIAWSVDQLQPAESSLFEALAAFVGGWDLEAARAVAAPQSDELDTVDLLARLVDKSLAVVERRGGEGTRYRFLEPIRQFALERLDAAGRGAEVRARHLAHFVTIAERIEPRLYGAEQATWLRALGADHDNLLAAVRASEDLPNGVEPALRIVHSIRRLWITRGQLRLGEELILRVLARADANTPPLLRARALGAVCALRFRQNRDDFPELMRVQSEALDLYRAAGDRRGTAQSLQGLGLVAIQIPDLPAATDYFEQSLAIDLELGNPRNISITMHNLALSLWYRGEREAALDRLIESLRTLGESGDRSEHANGSVNLGFIQMRLGRRSEARGSFLLAMSFFAEVDSRNDVAASALLGAAEFLSDSGPARTAARLYGAARALLAVTMTGPAYRTFPWDEQPELVRRLEARLGQGLAESLASGEAMAPDQALRAAIEALPAAS